MRTIKEIKKHLKETGYTKSSLKNIRFFLLGKGLIQSLDEIDFQVARGKHNYEDFANWFRGESNEQEDEQESTVFDTVVTFENGDGKTAPVPVVSMLKALHDLGFTFFHPDMMDDLDDLIADFFGDEFDEEADQEQGEEKEEYATVLIEGVDCYNKKITMIEADTQDVIDTLEDEGYTVTAPEQSEKK